MLDVFEPQLSPLIFGSVVEKGCDHHVFCDGEPGVASLTHDEGGDAEKMRHVRNVGTLAPFDVAAPDLGFESCQLHSSRTFRVTHKRTPHQPAAKVLNHQNGDAQIDPEAGRIKPFWRNIAIERIDKAVASPCWGGFPIPVHGLQNLETFVRQENQRPCGGARDNRPIDWPLCRRSAPGFVAVYGHGGGDAPVVFVVPIRIG